MMRAGGSRDWGRAGGLGILTLALACEPAQSLEPRDGSVSRADAGDADDGGSDGGHDGGEADADGGPPPVARSYVHMVGGATLDGHTTTCVIRGAERELACWGTFDRGDGEGAVTIPGPEPLARFDGPLRDLRSFTVLVGNVCFIRAPLGLTSIQCRGINQGCGFFPDSNPGVSRVQACLGDWSEPRISAHTLLAYESPTQVGGILAAAVGCYDEARFTDRWDPVPRVVGQIATFLPRVGGREPTPGDLCGANAGGFEETGWDWGALDTGGNVWDRADGEFRWRRLPFGGPVDRAASSGVHTCAVLRGSGAVECLGSGEDGQLGAPAEGWVLDTPVRVAVPPSTAVAAAQGVGCALTEAGEVWCWGARATLQLPGGDGSPSIAPTRLALPEPAVALAEHGLCALSANHDVFCWGRGRPDTSATEVAPGVEKVELR